MSTHRRRRLTRTSSERLIDDIALGSAGAATPLTELLRAAAATPEARHELAGEAEALTALHAARLATASPRMRIRKPVVSTVLTVKVAVIATAVVTLGGAAVAAGIGILPSPFSGAEPGVSVSASASTSGARSIPSPTRREPTPVSPISATARPSLPGSAAKSLSELCHAYVRLDAKNQAEALRREAFKPLVVAAGGTDRVAVFCARFEPPPKESPKPSPSSPKPNPSIPKPGASDTQHAPRTATVKVKASNLTGKPSTRSHH